MLAVTLRGLSIAPHKFRAMAARAGTSAARGGALVRFRLNRAAQVTLTVSRSRPPRGRIVVRGRAGINSVRFTGRLAGHRLAAGHYRLLASAGSTSSSTSFEVTASGRRG
jgi:hypothetical protein